MRGVQTGPGGDGVDADAVGGQHLGQPLGEGDDRPLRHRVVQQVGARLVRLHRRGVDDRAARRDVRQGVLAQPEHPVQVGAHDAVELFGGDGGDPVGLGHLVGRVVDQDVDAPERGDGALDERAALLLVPDVAEDGDRPAAGLFDQPNGLVGLFLLLGEVRQHHVRALAGVRQGDRAADAGVASRDDRLPAVEQAGAAVGLLTVVGRRVHGAGPAGMLLVLLREVGAGVEPVRVLRLFTVARHDCPLPHRGAARTARAVASRASRPGRPGRGTAGLTG